MKRETYEMLHRLESCGISWEDANTLRRISMTLHRWHEGECGNDNGCIERDEVTGKPFNTRYSYTGKRVSYPIPDREKGALRRLSQTMAKYPTLSAYVQGDPRGCALYILRPGDVPEGKNAESYYSRGIAVFK